MSTDCETAREMTLREWVERLPSPHRARKEFNKLTASVDQLLNSEQCEGTDEHISELRAISTRLSIVMEDINEHS